MSRRNGSEHTTLVGPTPLAGERVALVPVTLVAADHLYEIATATSVAVGWEGRGRVPDRARFAELVGGELSYALVDGASGDVAGHVGLHDVDPWAATGRLSAFVDPRLALAPLLAAEGIDRFLRHAFAHAGLRKVTAEVAAGATTQLARLLSRHRGVTHEGTRRRHVRIGPRLVDLDLYAVWGDEYLAAAAPGLGLLAACPEVGAGRPTAAVVRELVSAVTPGHLDPAAVDGRQRLVADLGLDSLALLELVDALEELVGGTEPLDLLDVDAELTVADLVRACTAPSG